MAQENQRLQFSIIGNSKPFDLIELTASLSALGEQFKSFAKAEGYEVQGEDLRLYVKSLKSGSIEAELISLAAQTTLLTIAHFNLAADFARNLNAACQYFLSGVSAPKPISPPDAKRIAAIVQPTASDAAAQLNVSVSDGGVAMVNFSIPSVEANAIQNGVRRYLSERPDISDDVHEKELFYWYQARDDLDAKTGDKGIVERFSSRPVKALFASEAVKAAMLDVPHLFKMAFVVDVRVQKMQGRIGAYKILHVHEAFERPD